MTRGWLAMSLAALWSPGSSASKAQKICWSFQLCNQAGSREGVDGAFGQDHGLRWGNGNGQPEASGRFPGTGGHHPEAAAVGAHQGTGNFGAGNPALSIGA